MPIQKVAHRMAREQSLEHVGYETTTKNLRGKDIVLNGKQYVGGFEFE